MAEQEDIRVSLTPQQVEFLANCVASGRYQSASEVVREGLRLVEDQQRHREAMIERARSLVQEGADQVDRGQTIDADTFFADWDQELADQEAQRRETP